ncbi:MAG: DUF2878 domain-containing protein [Thiothrix sp.]|nr:MAG: DUF2878 domain-containing protein [Thiothrix sp.]
MLKQPLAINLADLAIFQSIWWLAALWGNSALLGLAALLSLHLMLLPEQLKRDCLAVLVLGPLGWGIDLALQALGFWNLHSQWPFWLLAIWAGFILSLFYSLAWLQKISIINQALIGSLAASLSYLGGAKLGALSFNYSLLSSLAMLAILWAILLPSLVASLYLFKNNEVLQER